MMHNVLYGPSDMFKDGIFEITQYTLINVVTLNGVSFKYRCFALLRSRVIGQVSSAHKKCAIIG